MNKERFANNLLENIGASLQETVFNKFKACKNHILNEGAWGYEPHNSDSYLDKTHDLTRSLKKELLNGIKSKDDHERFMYMGFINGFLKADNIWDEVIHSDDYDVELFNAYEKAFNEMYAKTDNERGWSDFSEYKKMLKKTFNDFKKIMVDKYYFVIDTTKNEYNDDEYQEITKLPNGVYVGRRYGYMFELKDGSLYHCKSYTERKKKDAEFYKHAVKNGKITAASNVVAELEKEMKK